MKNRISRYDPGWLPWLVDQRLATASQARRAEYRAATEGLRHLFRAAGKKRRKRR